MHIGKALVLYWKNIGKILVLDWNVIEPVQEWL